MAKAEFARKKPRSPDVATNDSNKDILTTNIREIMVKKAGANAGNYAGLDATPEQRELPCFVDLGLLFFAPPVEREMQNAVDLSLSPQ